MSGATVRVEGLAALRRGLRELDGNLDDLAAANAEAAQFVASTSAARAPRRTGRLAASVRPAKAKGRATVLLGGAAVPYAGPIHWGWAARHIEPNRFVWDTAKATEPTWLPIYEREIQRLCDRVGGA